MTAKIVKLSSALAFLLIVASDAHAAPSPSIAERIAEALNETPLDTEYRNLEHEAALRLFYGARGFRPIWIADGAPNDRAIAVQGVLARANEEGLDTKRYLLPPTARDKPALFELSLSSAVFRYAKDTHAGRVEPRLLDPDLFLPTRRIDLPDILTQLAEATDPKEILSNLSPRLPGYRHLKAALARYRTIAAAGGWTPVPGGPALAPGARDARVIALRARLESADKNAPPNGDSDVYGTGLSDAVRRFQTQMGLDPDGIVGRRTLAALNVPIEQRVRQMILNMERLRWMPDDLGRDHIKVNVAGYDLRAVTDGKPVLTMRVIVGTPFRRTPVFSEKLSYLEFNPFWNIPTRNALEDLAPKLAKNPNYFAEQGIVVFDGWSGTSQPLDPSGIDWKRYNLRNFPYQLRQEPGSKNALGRVKFMFPNDFSVYLHDTPARELFDGGDRAFSSGCIRVERPKELAEFALQDQPEWVPEKIDEALANGNRRIVKVQRPIMIHLTYATAWADENLELHFRDDIYDRDQRLGTALKINQ